MTLSDFIDLVYENAIVEGQPFIPRGNTSLVFPFIDSQFAAICAKTKCFYSDRITMTIAQGDKRLDLRDTTVFSKRIVLPESIWIDGAQLRNMDGLPGPTGLDEQRIWRGDYQTETQGKPAQWSMFQPSTLVLFPESDAAYDNCYATGWTLHEPCDNLSQTVEFLDEHLYPVARIVARELILPYSAEKSAEKAEVLRQLNKLDLDLIQSAASLLLQGVATRGAKRAHSFKL